MAIRLSVLDQSPIARDSTGAQALQNTLDLAKLTDGLGYHRYWVAEHHGTPRLACTSPEVLIGPIAMVTSRLRVGSAAGTDAMTTLALQRDRRQRAPNDFREHLQEVLAHLWNQLPSDHPFARHATTLPGR